MAHTKRINKYMINKGFSIIELLIVVIIIGIIAAITIPSLLGSKRAIDQKVAVTQLGDFNRAQKSYKDDLNIGRYATLTQLRNTTPSGNPLIDPQMVDTNGAGLNYKGWIIGQIEAPTATTFGVKMIPAEGNPADYSFFMYENGEVRKTGLTGPWTRGAGTIVEQ